MNVRPIDWRLLATALVVSLAGGCDDAMSPDVPSTDATGAIQVTAITTGSSIDTDGYTVAIYGKGEQVLGANATVVFTELVAGVYTVQLKGVAWHCDVNGTGRVVAVAAGETAAIRYVIECGAEPSWVRSQQS